MPVFTFKTRPTSVAQIRNQTLLFGLDFELIDQTEHYVFFDVAGPERKVAELWSKLRNNRDKFFIEFLATVDQAPATQTDGNFRTPGVPSLKVPGFKLGAS